MYKFLNILQVPEKAAEAAKACTEMAVAEVAQITEPCIAVTFNNQHVYNDYWLTRFTVQLYEETGVELYPKTWERNDQGYIARLILSCPSEVNREGHDVRSLLSSPKGMLQLHYSNVLHVEDMNFEEPVRPLDTKWPTFGFDRHPS